MNAEKELDNRYTSENLARVAQYISNYVSYRQENWKDCNLFYLRASRTDVGMTVANFVRSLLVDSGARVDDLEFHVSHEVNGVGASVAFDLDFLLERLPAPIQS